MNDIRDVLLTLLDMDRFPIWEHLQAVRQRVALPPEEEGVEAAE